MDGGYSSLKGPPKKMPRQRSSLMLLTSDGRTGQRRNDCAKGYLFFCIVKEYEDGVYLHFGPSRERGSEGTTRLRWN